VDRVTGFNYGALADRNSAAHERTEGPAPDSVNVNAMANGIASRSAPNVGARVYPAGRAVVVLGACAPEVSGRRLTIEGRRVQAVRFGRLALLLSFVDGAAYTPESIERMRDDAAWLAGEARLLENAVERVRVLGAVLPMPLLTVYSHPETLEESAREQYRKWSRSLTRLGTKRECVVHLFVGPHVPPGGAPYVVRIALRASRTGRPPSLKGRSPAIEHARSVWRSCVEASVATRRVPTSGERGALWSGVMLLEESSVEALAAIVKGGVSAGLPLGVTAYLEAPRAPFSFVS